MARGRGRGRRGLAAAAAAAAALLAALAGGEGARVALVAGEGLAADGRGPGRLLSSSGAAGGKKGNKKSPNGKGFRFVIPVDDDLVDIDDATLLPSAVAIDDVTGDYSVPSDDTD